MNISSAEANASIKVPGETTPSDFNLVKGRDIFGGGGGNLLSEEGGPVRIVDFLGQGENVFRDWYRAEAGPRSQPTGCGKRRIQHLRGVM